MNDIYYHWFYGGYPEPRITGVTNQNFYHLWMDQYFQNYLQRDVRRLFPRLSEYNFRKFLQTLAYHSGKTINQSNLSRALEVTSVTVKEYLDIVHHTFIWRNLQSYEKNSLKKVQKMPKGHFRDSGLFHHLLKIPTIDHLLVHPEAGFSFKSFMIEEIIRGFHSTMGTNIDYSFYRTKDKSEIDLIVEGNFGTIPIEIKLGSSFNPKMIVSLNNFMKDMKSPIGILVNNSTSIELVGNNIFQIPSHYW